MLSELTPIDWAVQTLLADATVAGYVGNRIDDSDNVPPFGPADTASSYFPRIVYSGTPHGDPWAETLIRGYGEFTFRVLMREDALPGGQDLKSYTGAMGAAVCGALTTAINPTIHHAIGGTGEVAGCSMVDFYAPPLYGPDGRRICERGCKVRIDWT